jgi:acetylornithine deacetylase/succinyl-diaminopimelate desuccinylase-like protein
MFAPGEPSIVYGLRGLAYLQIDIQGPNRDLHSGSYGGAVVNPINALAHIIAQLKDANGTITIPGFYDAVLELTPTERESLNALGYSDERLMSDVDVDAVVGEPGFTTIERLGARPTLDVNGILGGFTGEGAKTVLPARAMAKVSMRLVPHQKHDDIATKVIDYVTSIAPPGTTVNVHDLHGADPVLVDISSPAIVTAAKALEETFGVTCRFTREGGSIPVVLLFDTVLKAPTVLMGFGLNNENAHSPDEHFSLSNFHTGMRAVARYYAMMGQA